ncbi:hypothetical protein ACH9D2_10515 [Kocuria sp. M4R2S49]|uniref:hypothetical protein n=1 Tax=Kocuria rhizosphaericola TaxID=3376284 RepID=UPI0037AD8BFD
MHPRTMTARWRATPGTAAAALVVVLLGGCGSPGTPGPPTGSPPGTAPTATPATSPAGTPGPAGHGRWGAYPDRREACAAVADDLLALALLPAGLSAGPSVAEVQDVEDEVEAVLEAAPPALAADLARVQLLVDSYGETLAEDPSARFDGQALDEALAPVREWLDETCRNGG